MSLPGRVSTEAIVSKGPLSFKETDIRRALRAAQKEGVDVRIEIIPDQRRLSITTLKPDKCADVAAENLKDLL